MATEDSYGQGVMIAALTDPPDAKTLAQNLAEGIVALSNMSFASSSERSATITSPVEGMRTWLRDVDREDIYDGTGWRQVWTGITPAVSNVQADTYTTVSATYTTATTGGVYAHCQVTFTAPASGKIKWTVMARLEHSASNGVLATAEVRAGSTPGSGAIVDAASDWGPSHFGSDGARSGASHVVSGLTPGGAYNARILHRMTGVGGAGTISLRELIVEPLA
ncbi:hypothetical protein [Streptomyces niveus]|uniref:hypothetical protein n=1 Tax=Streptomyces niveus TaxID=193462 RepID=UPI0036D27B60